MNRRLCGSTGPGQFAASAILSCIASRITTCQEKYLMLAVSKGLDPWCPCRKMLHLRCRMLLLFAQTHVIQVISSALCSVLDKPATHRQTAAGQSRLRRPQHSWGQVELDTFAAGSVYLVRLFGSRWWCNRTEASPCTQTCALLQG